MSENDHTVWIALGSNLGERAKTLGCAVDRMGDAGLDIESCSHLYETAPEHGKDEPPYLNGVVRAKCGLAPAELLELLHEVEKSLGRTRGTEPEPRTCDLDLLAFDDRVVSEPGLTLPHPRLAERSFVLVPLCELDPRWQLPGTEETAAELLGRLPHRSGDVRVHSSLSWRGDCREISYAWRGPRGGRVGV